MKRHEALSELGGVLLTVLLALTIGFVIVLITSNEPVEAYRIFLTGALSNKARFGNFLERAIPLTFTGLAAALAFRVRVFNIGTEGQFYLGALGGTLVALFVPMPTGLHTAAAMLAGAAAGALFAAIPGYFRAYWGADEIVTTLMMNFIATLGVSYLLVNQLRDTRSGYTQTVSIMETAHLHRFFPPSRLHVGFFVGLLLALGFWYLLFHTTRGYQLRMSGLNPDFATYGGIKTENQIFYAMLLSGAAAGLGGAVEILGTHHKLIINFSPGYGFTGIIVALLARNHPLLVPVAALFYAYLDAGAVIMERSTDVSHELVSVIQGVLFLFVTAQAFFRAARSMGINIRFPWDKSGSGGDGTAGTAEPDGGTGRNTMKGGADIA